MNEKLPIENGPRFEPKQFMSENHGKYAWRVDSHGVPQPTFIIDRGDRFPGGMVFLCENEDKANEFYKLALEQYRLDLLNRSDTE